MDKSPVAKHSIVINGHKTSVSLEEAFWNGMKEISAQHGKTVSELITGIDSGKDRGNLSSAIRLFVLDYYKAGGGDLSGSSQAHSDDVQHATQASE
jgi:predicted DNA-binding ribbon-helix-helix protein